MRQWTSLDLDDEELRRLEDAINARPEAGKLIPGGNGLRKLRLADSRSNKGKSGGYRTFYYLAALRFGTVILWGVIGKSRKADLDKASLRAIARAIDEVEDLLEKGSF